jgi:hypothetical protein
MINKNPILSMIVDACVLAPMLLSLIGPSTNVANYLAIFTIAFTPPHLTIDV